MKKFKLAILISSLFIVGCSNQNKGSTAMSNSSTSSFNGDNVNEVTNIISNVNLNTINDLNGLTPTIGDIDILLVPIHFSDSNNTMDVDLIDKAFNFDGQIEDEWYSVKKYYEISSYNKCHLNFVMQDIITLNHDAKYYTEEFTNTNYVYGTNEIVKEVLNALDYKIDFTKFDSNSDGYIDGIYLVYDYPVDFTLQKAIWWAFTYYFSCIDGYENITFDNMKVQSYVFAGYDFFTQYNHKIRTNTFIHETAHMFGIDDYYDTNSNSGAVQGGLASGDIMDGTIGDHNAFTKALLSWNQGKYIHPKKNMQIELDAFQKNGDYIILSNDFVESSNILQEYFILEYYTPTGLNEYEKMFKIPGIRVLHVVANTRKNGQLQYNNSTTNVKLISQITTSDGKTYISSSTARSDNTLFTKDEELINVKYVDNVNLQYSFKVVDLNEKKATLLITNKKEL